MSTCRLPRDEFLLILVWSLTAFLALLEILFR
jgi:hypothetical protein